MDTVPSSKNISSTLVPLFADVSVNSIPCLIAYPWPFYEQKWKDINVWIFIIFSKKKKVKECAMLRDVQSMQISASQYFNIFFYH